MIDFDWLLTNLTSWSYLCSKTLHIFWGSWSYGNRRDLLNVSLLLDLWHLILSTIVGCALPIVHSTSISKDRSLSWGTWSLSAVQSNTSCWGWLFKSSWKGTCRLIADTTWWHELSDILPGGWASQKWLWQSFWDLAVCHEWMHTNLL